MTRGGNTQLLMNRYFGIYGYAHEKCKENSSTVPLLGSFKQSVTKTLSRMKQGIIDIIDDYIATLETRMAEINKKPEIFKIHEDQISVDKMRSDLEMSSGMIEANLNTIRASFDPLWVAEDDNDEQLRYKNVVNSMQSYMEELH